MATGRRGAAAYADAHKLIEKMGMRKLADAGSSQIRNGGAGIAGKSVEGPGSFGSFTRPQRLGDQIDSPPAEWIL